MNKPYFILYTNCISVKGARRSVICDLQRKTITHIPNDLYEIIQLSRKKTIDEIKNIYIKDRNIIEEYYNFLIEKELGFFCEDVNLFPELDLCWDRPSIITNAVIDIDNNYTHSFNNIFNELNELGCESIQLRFFNGYNLNSLNNLLKCTSDSLFNSISILLKYNEDLNDKNLRKLCEDNPRITDFNIYSTPNHLIEKEQYLNYGNAHIMYDKSRSNSCEYCGNISKYYFVCNLPMYTEALKFNSCLNRKISIDTEGNIKNCPSMINDFGNIKNTTLSEAIHKKDFKKLWNITKDQIEECKDCEYRYVCTDCRVFIKDNANIYSKPSKCNYNPYKSVWE